MNSVSKASRVLLVSPWSLLVFLVIPVLVIVSLTTHVALPLVGPQLLLGNNICFALLICCRLIWYFSRLGAKLRYANYGKPSGDGFVSRFPAGRTRETLAGGGFHFNSAGDYGEKHDLGYLGTTVLYAGLFLLLATGSWDNLHQFSGVILDGPGPASKLAKAETYRSLNMGPLAKLSGMPQLRILSQTLPDSTYRKGATEIALVPENGDPLSTVLVPTTPYIFRGYEVYMTKLVFQPELVIKDKKDGRVLFDDLVMLDPLVQKRGDYSFYGLFAGREVVGGAYYNPDKSQMMLVVTRNGKRELADLTFQVDQQVTTGDYILSCARMGQWSEIHVVHHRHMELLIAGGIIAALGLLLRLAVPAQRVWLAESDGSCRVTAVGKEAKRLLETKTV